MAEYPQVHGTTRLTTPHGAAVNVDAGMADLIRALWGAGYETLMCCQDAGEAIRGGGTPIQPERWERYAAFYAGFAWLKTPVPDMQRLVTTTADIAKGHGWAPCINITPQGTNTFAHLHFPARQIEAVTALVKRDS